MRTATLTETESQQERSMMNLKCKKANAIAIRNLSASVETHATNIRQHLPTARWRHSCQNDKRQCCSDQTIHYEQDNNRLSQTLKEDYCMCDLSEGYDPLKANGN